VEIASRDSKRKSAVARAVYDGRSKRGHFIKNGETTFTAYDRRGRPLGVFDNAHQAANAVSDAAARDGVE
jgi:hypothetical protein